MCRYLSHLSLLLAHSNCLQAFYLRNVYICVTYNAFQCRKMSMHAFMNGLQAENLHGAHAI